MLHEYDQKIGIQIEQGGYCTNCGTISSHNALTTAISLYEIVT